jgi:hypothetical protein
MKGQKDNRNLFLILTDLSNKESVKSVLLLPGEHGL